MRQERKLLCKKTQIFCINSIGRARKSELQLTNKSTFSVHECLNCVSCFERVWCAAAAVKMQSNAMFAERRTHMYSHDEMMGYQWLQCIVQSQCYTRFMKCVNQCCMWFTHFQCGSTPSLPRLLVHSFLRTHTFSHISVCYIGRSKCVCVCVCLSIYLRLHVYININRVICRHTCWQRLFIIQ